ncbi:MAG: AbrB/MazE/SpoVT family DNA-binding domain-containing protein [Acidobacteriota bacterium]
MESRIQKWGNSLAVRIPKPYASEVGVLEDAAVVLRVSEGALVITPASRHVYRLDELLASVRPSNLHSEQLAGAPRGKGVW